MKTFKVLILVLSCAGFTSVTCAQVSAVAMNKAFTVKAAASFVNSDLSYQTVAPEKSSLSTVENSKYEMVRGYDKKVNISYQIASANAIEWAVVRMRAAEVLDVHNWIYLTSKGVFDPLYKLAWDDYVPMSVYAPFTIKLNFNYNSKKFPSYFSSEGFAPMNNSPSIHTKTLLIKK